MDWLNKILKSPGAGSSNALWLYVQCSRCGAPVAVRVNLLNDLSEQEDGRYLLRKEIIDSKCFRLMVAEIRFDASRRIVEQILEGGRFVSKAEYAALRDQHPREKKREE